MKNWGNGKVNAMYMPHPEKHPPPTSMEGSAMEQYIRSKYERKQFMEGGGGGGGNSYQVRAASRPQRNLAHDDTSQAQEDNLGWIRPSVEAKEKNEKK